MNLQTETRTWARRARPWLLALEIVAWAVFFAFALTFLALRYWVLPNIERYRSDIVATISHSIGLPVTIGAIETDWRGLRPQISIADVRVFDLKGREALVLPAVEHVIGWRSVFALELRLHSFVVDRPKVTVRRDAQGLFHVAGIRVSPDKGGGGLGDWLLAQRELMVRDAEIEWIDELRQAPPLALTALNFRLRNAGDRHSIGISARTPRELGAGLELRAELVGERIGQPGEWRGRVYAESGYTDLAGWRAWIDYPVDVRHGKGALRVWATLARGMVTRATADVAMTGVVARLGADLPVLAVSSVRGRLEARETPRGYEFGVRGLALSMAQAPAMSATSFRASVEGDTAVRDAEGRLAGGWRPLRGSVSASLIELAPLAHLAEFLPFPADLRKVLAELAPQGNLLDTRFEWTGELPDKAIFRAKSRFAGLAMNPWRTIPGFAALSGSVEATEKKGTVYLASQNAELDLPKVFPQPRVKLDTLGGEVAWEFGAGSAVSVRLANIGFANEDLAGSAFGSYLWTGEGPGVADLSAQLTRADGRDLARYLPLGSIMGETTRDWLTRAILAADASDVRFRLKGDLREFPFADPTRGQFLVAAKVSNAVLDYVAGWPRIEDIHGDLIFERERMEIAGRGGRILGTQIANVRVAIPSLLAAQTLLTVDGQAEGPTGEFLKYIQQSPVREMIGGFTDGMSADGRGKLRLRLDLPLGDLGRSRVAGEYQFSGNTVTLDPRLPPVERAAGRVTFTESTLTVHDVKGRLFGGEVTLGGGSRPDTGIAITARGEATLEGTRAVFDHPWRARLQGKSDYNAAFTVREGRSHLKVESQLRGISSDLPPPFAKAAGDAVPLRVEVFPGQGRDRIAITLSGVVHAEYLRVAQGEAMQVQRAAVAFGAAAAEPIRMPERAGTSLYGSLGAFDLDRWLPMLGGAAAGRGATAFDLRFDSLDALGKRLRNATFRGATDADGWVANLSAAELAGDFSYRDEDGGRLAAHLKRFTMPQDSPGAKPGAATRDLPSVDLVVEDFNHRGRRLGRVEILARHEGADWRIEKLSMLNPEASLKGRGLWRTGEASRTFLDFQLDVNDVGGFLTRMGTPDQVKGGRASLAGGLNWSGDPVTMDYATLAGDLKLEGEDGQFLEIEPGIGKLVSLMSLQMLPRRITLDFRDVFSKGFKWDKIGSDLSIARGVMAVNKFAMTGPAAEVRMGGDIDLGLETQNLKVTVIPSLGDTASTVVGLINPAAGVATMIAQRALKNPLGEIFAFEYAISGTWTDPKVQKLEPVTVPDEALENLDPSRPRPERPEQKK
jgi:uncharacterized protein (TIGR02099 family)